MKCPICRKPVEKGDAEFPFCSERCRILDLGNWASGKYFISTPVQPASESGKKPRRMSNKLALLLASWFGCGYSPFAPGTAGSAAALAIVWPAVAIWRWTPLHFLALAAAILIPAVWSAGAAARLRGVSDPGVVVIDEVVGQWIALSGATVLNWKSCAAAFFLFRALDIWKPAPARQAERLHGGVGIVADDVVAGAYSALVLFILGCFNLY